MISKRQRIRVQIILKPQEDNTAQWMVIWKVLKASKVLNYNISSQINR